VHCQLEKLILRTGLGYDLESSSSLDDVSKLFDILGKLPRLKKLVILLSECLPEFIDSLETGFLNLEHLKVLHNPRSDSPEAGGDVMEYIGQLTEALAKKEKVTACHFVCLRFTQDTINLDTCRQFNYKFKPCRSVNVTIFKSQLDQLE